MPLLAIRIAMPVGAYVQLTHCAKVKGPNWDTMAAF